MPFEYYNIEDDMVAALQTGFTQSSLDIDTVPLPEDESEVVKAIGKPRVTVAFVAVVASKTKSTNEQSYEEDITMVVNIQWKALRGANGCHTIATLVKKYIIGFQPTNCGRMYFKNYQGSSPVRNPDDKLWYWDLEFGVKKLYVQQVNDDEVNGPNLETLIFNEQQCS